jgi:hypothetical protein
MDFEKYENTFPYDNFETEIGKAYRQEQTRLEKMFFDDMADDLGYADNSKRGIFESICWSHGHSSGYSEVYNVALELVELIN